MKNEMFKVYFTIADCQLAAGLTNSADQNLFLIFFPLVLSSDLSTCIQIGTYLFLNRAFIFLCVCQQSSLFTDMKPS